MRLPTALATISLLAAPVGAQPAAPPPPDAPPPPADVEYSYRAETMAIDVLALGAGVLGAYSEDADGGDGALTGPLFTASIGGLLLGAPIIHLRHGSPGRAVLSLSLRFGLSSVGAAIALQVGEGCEGFLCELDYLGPGVFAGLVAASAIDNALLPYGSRPLGPVRAARAWAPTVAPAPGGAQVGLVGTF